MWLMRLLGFRARILGMRLASGRDMRHSVFVNCVSAIATYQG